MLRTLLFTALLALTAAAQAADKKTIVMIAGKPSHGPAQHEHNAGVQLLAKCLQQHESDKLEIKIHLNADWPSDAELEKADSVVIYADGGPGHPAIQEAHLKSLEAAMNRGCGLV